MYDLIFWISWLLSLAFTAAIYGAGPMLFVACRKKQPTIRALRIFCAFYTLSVWVIVQLFSYGSGEIRATPAILWSCIFYNIAKSVSAKKLLTLPQDEQKEQAASPQSEDEMCEMPFAQAEETSPAFDVSEEDYQRAMHITSLNLWSKELKEISQVMKKTPIQTKRYFEDIVRNYNLAKYGGN